MIGPPLGGGDDGDSDDVGRDLGGCEVGWPTGGGRGATGAAVEVGAGAGAGAVDVAAGEVVLVVGVVVGDAPSACVTAGAAPASPVGAALTDGSIRVTCAAREPGRSAALSASPAPSA